MSTLLVRLDNGTIRSAHTAQTHGTPGVRRAWALCSFSLSLLPPSFPQPSAVSPPRTAEVPPPPEVTPRAQRLNDGTVVTRRQGTQRHERYTTLVCLFVNRCFITHTHTDTCPLWGPIKPVKHRTESCTCASFVTQAEEDKKIHFFPFSKIKFLLLWLQKCNMLYTLYTTVLSVRYGRSH